MPCRIAVVVLVLLTTACGDDDVAPTGPVAFADTTVGFAFDYPDGWERIDDIEIETTVGEVDTLTLVAFGTLDGSSGNLIGMSVQADRLAEIIPESQHIEFLEQAFDPVVTQLAEAAGGSLQGAEAATINGKPARRYVIDSMSRNQDLTTELTAFIDEDRFFKLTCQAPREQFAATEPGCDVVLGSFRLTG
jgi:hypothetical protein